MCIFEYKTYEERKGKDHFRIVLYIVNKNFTYHVKKSLEYYDLKKPEDSRIKELKLEHSCTLHLKLSYNVINIREVVMPRLVRNN